jgi:plastocyanin
MNQMNNLILVLYILSTFISGNTTTYLQSNEVTGVITVSNCQKTVTQGDGYNKDGTEIMHSDDPMTQPKRNIIISMHPLTFDPELFLTEDAYVSQSQQTFIPNVLPIVVGSKVHFLNEDEFFHNVQSYTSKSRFSIGRRAPGISYSIKIKKIGVVDLTCDIHPHMNAKILSFDTPYFCRLNEDGSFSLKGLPNGKYRLEVFHPYCDKIVEELEVIGGKVFEFNYHLSQKV